MCHASAEPFPGGRTSGPRVENCDRLLGTSAQMSLRAPPKELTEPSRANSSCSKRQKNLRIFKKLQSKKILELRRFGSGLFNCSETKDSDHETLNAKRALPPLPQLTFDRWQIARFLEGWDTGKIRRSFLRSRISAPGDSDSSGCQQCSLLSHFYVLVDSACGTRRRSDNILMKSVRTR